MNKQPINASGISWAGVFDSMAEACGGHHESAVIFQNEVVMKMAEEAKEQGGRFPRDAVERLRMCLFQVFAVDGGIPLRGEFSRKKRQRAAEKESTIYEFACRPGEEVAVRQVLDEFAEKYADFDQESVVVGEPLEKAGEAIPKGIFDERISQMIASFLRHENPRHMKLKVRKGDHKRNMEDGTPFHEYIARQVAAGLNRKQLGKLKKVPTVAQTGCVRVKLFNQKERPGDRHCRDFFVVIPFKDGSLKVDELSTEWGFDRNKQDAA